MERMVNSLDINEEKSIKNTLLYLKNVEINTEGYEYKILSEEFIENIIKFQLIYDGANQVLKYDVSSTISLDEYLKTIKLKKKDICDILLAIDDVLFSIENYLISENSVILDLRAIRLKKLRNGHKRYQFIAVPNLKADFSYELSKFLIRILRFVDVDDKEALSLAYGLFVRSSKDNYTMNDLIELVEKVRDKNADVQDDITMEELVNYDEEMAKEISEEMLQENGFDIQDIDEENEKKYTGNTNNESMNIDEGITIDDETNDILQESVLNDFNKQDKKIVKFKKYAFGFKKKRALNGHINLGMIAYAIVPVVIIVVPVLVFFLNT